MSANKKVARMEEDSGSSDTEYDSDGAEEGYTGGEVSYKHRQMY